MVLVKSALRFVSALLLLAAGSVPMHAQDAPATLPSKGPLTVSQAWARATPPGAPVAGGYFTVTNTGAQPDRLVAAASPRAATVEVHAMRVDGGRMEMRPLKQGLTIAPGESVTLAPGGLHLMFMQIGERFEAGDSVPLTLEFEHAGIVELELPVAPIGTQEAPAQPSR